MGGCQNLGILNNRCRIRLRTQKGSLILTTTHITLESVGLFFVGEANQITAYTDLPFQATIYRNHNKEAQKGRCLRLQAGLKGFVGEDPVLANGAPSMQPLTAATGIRKLLGGEVGSLHHLGSGFRIQCLFVFFGTPFPPAVSRNALQAVTGPFVWRFDT